MSLVGRWLGIKCYKHDGTVHRIWDRGFVVDNNSDFIVVATKKAKVVESNGRKWFTKEPAVTIFSKNEWWNVICMFKDGGIGFYCNIASPCLVGKNTINYIDYDLDTKLYVDGKIKVLDEKEYQHHKASYNYSDDLDKVLRLTTSSILLKMKNKEFPFDSDSIKKYYEKFLEMSSKKND